MKLVSASGISADHGPLKLSENTGLRVVHPVILTIVEPGSHHLGCASKCSLTLMRPRHFFLRVTSKPKVPCMKLNSTIPNRKVIFRDTIPGIEVFRNFKFQAPNSNEIPNSNIQ